jgi:hypothetical protein
MATTRGEGSQRVAAILEMAVPLYVREEGTRRLVEKAAQCQIVLLGEASHGTHEFTRCGSRFPPLISEHGFGMIAAEADWPDSPGWTTLCVAAARARPPWRRVRTLPRGCGAMPSSATSWTGCAPKTPAAPTGRLLLSRAGPLQPQQLDPRDHQLPGQPRPALDCGPPATAASSLRRRAAGLWTCSADAPAPRLRGRGGRHAGRPAAPQINSAMEEGREFFDASRTPASSATPSATTARSSAKCRELERARPPHVRDVARTARHARSADALHRMAHNTHVAMLGHPDGRAGRVNIGQLVQEHFVPGVLGGLRHAHAP